MVDSEGNAPDFNPKDAGASFDHEVETMFETPAPTAVEPAPTPAPPAEPERPADETPSGPPRDDKGRFAKPAPPAESAPAPAATAPAAPPPATTETPTPESLPEASYRADGKDFTIQGSKQNPDGSVTIPADQWAQQQRLLGLGQVHQGSFQRRMSEAAQLTQREKTRADAAEASKAAVWGKLIKMMQDGTLEEWLGNQQQNLPVLLAEADREGDRLRLKEYEEREAAREREVAESQRGPQREAALSNAIRHYGAAAGLSEARMQQLYARLNSPEYHRALFFEAQEDDPINGIRKGDEVIALGLVENEVTWAGPGQTPAIDKVAQAAAANAKAQGQPVNAPPTVGAKGGVPSTKPAPKQFKTAQEADDYIFGDGFAELGRR